MEKELAERLYPLYQKMWDELPQELKEPDDLVPFVAQWGAKFPKEKHKGLLVIGKANNGWGGEGNDYIEEIFSDKGFNDLKSRDTHWMEESYDGPLPGGSWYGKRSAFMRMIHNLSINLYKDETNWASHIAYSNLYKIVSGESGNPSEALKEIEFEECTKILQTELEILSPRVALFLTSGWEEPFMQKIFGTQYLNNAQTLDWGYTTQYITKDGQTLIFSPHPERKDESAHLETLLQITKTLL